MNVYVLNATVLIAWLMFLVGTCLYDVRVGLPASALLLLLITAAVARAAGVFVPGRKKPTSEDAE